ncbi:MAG: CAP domain-containing protein [Nitrosopumilaceae archaeon]|nr:MAG: CAP domain-containing protein [Nitrosopumilaceae archaeon]
MNKILISSILAIILLCSVFTMNSAFGTNSTKKAEAKKVDVKKKMSDVKKAEKIKLAKERYAAKKLSKKKILEDKKSEPIQIGRGITHDDLIQYALKKINQDRQKYNFSPVSLSSNPAAQIHAEDVLKTRMISHWMSNGEKPYMTYTRLGGTGSVSQNVAISLCNGFGCNMDPIKLIESLESSMMYDDASSDWGHRDNILQPYHTQVGIGISYDDSFFTMVQNFEENYLLSENPITITGGDVQIHSNLKKVLPITVAIFYDPLPTSEFYSQHLKDHSYNMGDLVAVVQRPPPVNYYYDQPSGYKLIEATRWATNDTSIFIDFDASSVLSKPGVYTIGVKMNVDGRNTWITNYSKIYK